MKNTTVLKRSLTIAVFLLAALPFTSMFSVASVSAADKDCFKAVGNTAEEAFRAAVTLLNNKDKEMGPKWMKDNMQVRLLPEKVHGQFVAVIYSTVHHAGTCDLDKVRRIAEQDRPNCDKTKCTI